MKTNKVFNTGETPEELKVKYNPEGSVLRKAQLRMLDMLLYLDEVCKKIGVDYCIESGNVLGAVRHDGFIPWDDDVDVSIELKDYNKLCKYLIKHPHPQYVLQTPTTDIGYYNFWNVLRDTKSEYIVDSNVHKVRKYKGLQIDIFPYQNKRIMLLHKIARRITIFNQNNCIGVYPVLAKTIYCLQKNIIHPLFDLISFIGGKNDIYTYSYGIVFHNLFPQTVLYPHQKILFEHHVFPAPADIEQYLNILYGKEYMSLPPKEQRDHHNAKYIIY